jgi:two-component sensor histidine kinase
MASVHESLYNSKNLSKIDILPFLEKLTQSIITSYQLNSESISLIVDSDEIYLNIGQATPFGLVINELVSNSLKYAFPDGRKGKICINMNRTIDGIQVRFSDDGIGFPASLDWRNNDSLGLKLIINLVENQLKGSIQMETNNGTCFVIKFREVQN